MNTQEDFVQWLRAADELRLIRGRILTGENRPSYVCMATIEPDQSFHIVMVGIEDPAAVRSMLEALLKVAIAAEEAQAQQDNPNRTLN